MAASSPERNNSDPSNSPAGNGGVHGDLYLSLLQSLPLIVFCKDREGRYLLVQYESLTSRSMVIDLKTRQAVLQFNNDARLSTWYALHNVSCGSMYADGTLFLKVLQRLEQQSAGTSQYYFQELWSWNLFSGEWTKLRQYSPQVAVELAADGFPEFGGGSDSGHSLSGG